MFNVHTAIRLLDAYAREGCKSCLKSRECILSGNLDTNCKHGQALIEVREFHQNVKNGFQVVEAQFLTEVTKTATDGKTSLIFDAGDVFVVKGEFSQKQLLCREKCPGGKEFTVTKKTEGSVWQRIL